MGLGKGSCTGGSIFKGFTKYPRCQIFTCTRNRGVSYRCCYWCDHRETCADVCLNSPVGPSPCNQCIIPEDFDMGMSSYALGDPALPDDPAIRRAERTGLRPGESPDEPETECPICGKLCESLYLDIDNDVCGCENCLRKIDAADYDPDQ